VAEHERESSPAMGVANMLDLHVLPFIAQVEPTETRQRLMKLYASMQRVALGSHYAQKGA
jgi:hypothetical protein